MPGLRPGAQRNDFGVGFANPSLLGGFEELREFFPSRAANSATRAANAAINASLRASTTSNSLLRGGWHNGN